VKKIENHADVLNKKKVKKKRAKLSVSSKGERRTKRDHVELTTRQEGV